MFEAPAPDAFFRNGLENNAAQQTAAFAVEQQHSNKVKRTMQVWCVQSGTRARAWGWRPTGLAFAFDTSTGGAKRG